MIRFKNTPQTRSIATFLLVVILGIVVVQSLLFGLTLIGGGVLSSSASYAEQVFYEKVSSRLKTLQADMRNQWSPIGAYTERLATLPFPAPFERENDEAVLALWRQALPVLRDMLRSTRASDAFIILQNTAGGNAYHALYLRKIEHSLNDSEIMLLTGPGDLAKEYSILPSHLWTRDLLLGPETLPILNNPLSLLGTHPNPSMLAYWSPLVALQPRTSPAIFHSMPLLDSNGVPQGVMGIGIHEGYLSSLLPQREPSTKDTLGYLIAHRTSDNEVMHPMFFTSNEQKILFPPEHPLVTEPGNERLGIVKLQSADDTRSLYACVQPLRLYAHQTPFEDETWYLVGLIQEKNLYQFPTKIKVIFVGALLASMVLGCIGAGLVTRSITRPIVSLANDVENIHYSSNLHFKRTGFREIDHLTSAIETANTNIMHSTGRILSLIDMAQIPMGMFEVRHNLPRVFATDGLGRLFFFGDEAAELCANKERFIQRLQKLMEHPEPDEDAVYKIHDDPEKWIKMYMVSDSESMLGVVTDVTDDMLKKRRIRHERDYDALTGLCSRNFFRRQVSTLMEIGEGLGIAAMIMMDLDNFKQVNDCYGHQCGDDYLNAMAQRMGTFANSHSVIGRRSGDEFFVFLFRLEHRDTLYRLVNDFYAELNAQPFTFPDRSHSVIGLSMGLAWYNGQATFEALLHEADMALYEAKAHARGTLQERLLTP